MSRRNRQNPPPPERRMFSWVGRQGHAYWCEARRCFMWQYRYHCAAPPTAFVRWHGRVVEDHGLWQIVEYPGWDLSGPRLVVRESVNAAAEPRHYASLIRTLRERGYSIDNRLRYTPLGHTYIETPLRAEPVEPHPYLGAGI